MGQTAVALFSMKLTQDVYAGMQLLISCTGEGAYELQDTPFVLSGPSGPVVTRVTRKKTGHIYTLYVVLKAGSPADTLALERDTVFRATIWSVPKLGSNKWRFDITDGHTYPVNTNDGDTQGFSPLDQEARNTPFFPSQEKFHTVVSDTL